VRKAIEKAEERALLRNGHLDILYTDMYDAQEALYPGTVKNTSHIGKVGSGREFSQLQQR
jgi:hypothetical protein